MRTLLEEYHLLERSRRKPVVVNKAGVDPEVFALAKQGVAYHLSQRDYGDMPKGMSAGLASMRYKYVLWRVKEGYTSQSFDFHMVPLGGKTHQNYIGDIPLSKSQMFKTPKKAIAEIPVNSKWAYRGMSWGEWQSIRRSKKIQSIGGHNLGQEGLTFFAPHPGDAQSYAGGFAPTLFQPSKKRPGVIIAVDRKGMLSPKDRKDIPNGELAVLGSLPSSAIKKVWLLVPTEIKEGNLEMRYDSRARGKQRKWQEGSGGGGTVWTALIELPRKSR
jgi:hypothetical protein